ncbi:alpha/beta hydrolase family protein [Rhodobacter aestuarii]|uniref:Alpha/beta hydrolase fold n=1 Tax=Rhodobacter aestuarii TaxID=453582 RepID=A0A1N7JXJ0_9RHOB|nr:alpha/beta fold hydrolase [Rhodobacter aestuarii]PTV95950.1 alpha/beta hydrolase family protein [Rhodobacter aestuarii]SIS53914.1 alpha/beta hydrolase fold [Rhodobacter aestuarii]
MTHPIRHAALGLFALILVVVSVLMLERERMGVEMTPLAVGTTPVTLYQMPGADGPAVVVAHGFAGSRQIMLGYSLRLAQAGYRVLAFDYEGQGRNPTPMRGDVTKIEGTTVYLMAETRAVVAAARALPGVEGVALLGHSMATDIIIRAAEEEAAAGTPITAVIAISSFSEAITPSAPPRLLLISGAWEGMLRDFARKAVAQVDPAAQEGDLAVVGDVERRAVVAPHVGHVGVLYSPIAITAARDWLDRAFGRTSTGAIDAMGVWIGTLLTGLVLLFHPMVALLKKGPGPREVPLKRFLLAVFVPASVTPLALLAFHTNPLPVTAISALTAHLALYGVLQIALLHGVGLRDRLHWAAAGALVLWGIGVFGFAIDRYFTNFWPSPERALLIAVLALGTLPFMLGDALVTEAGRGALWRRVLARFAVLASLGATVALGDDDRMFVIMALPVLLAFWLVHGLLARWVARRAGAPAAGLGAGLSLAWVLGVILPLLAV